MFRWQEKRQFFSLCLVQQVCLQFLFEFRCPCAQIVILDKMLWLATSNWLMRFDMLFIVNIAAQVITFLAKCHTPRPHDFTLVTRECSGFPKTVVSGYSDLKNNTLATASTMPFSVTQTRQRRRWRQPASKSHRTEKHGRISLWSAATKFRCRKKRTGGYTG